MLEEKILCQEDMQMEEQFAMLQILINPIDQKRLMTRDSIERTKAITSSTSSRKEEEQMIMVATTTTIITTGVETM
jgi:hypothetical protein